MKRMTDHGWCRHYNGVANSPTCRACVEYDSVRDDSIVPARWPCTSPDAATTCAKYEPHTAEEIEAQEQAIAAALNAYNAIWTRETELCPECGATVEHLKQVGRSVYTRPCGHRIGQGRVPEVWK